MIENRNRVKPIFIVGSPRSGTSILAIGLRTSLKIPSYSEGHFLPLANHVMNAIEKYYGKTVDSLTNKRKAISHIDRNKLEEKILDVFYQEYSSLYSGDTWLDKTPGFEMIKAIPLLHKIWPDAKFIYAKRRGIENISSRVKKFPDVAFERHCSIWVGCMEEWLKVKDSVSDCSVEIEQREILVNPRAIAEKIGHFLDLDKTIVDSLHHTFSNENPESTSERTSHDAIDLNQTGWTERQIAIFRKYCGATNEKFGYSETSAYYL